MAKKKREQETFSYDVPFQERIVRTLYQDVDFTIHLGVPHLQPALFESNVHRWFAETLIGYAKKHGTGASIEAVKIEAERSYVSGRLMRKRDKTAVDALVDKLKRKVKDRSYIKEELFRFIKNQTFKDVTMNCMELMKKGQVDKIDKEVQRVLNVQSAAAGGMGHFWVRDRIERYKERITYVPNGVPTGLEVDKYMKPGGLPPKQLGAVVAPPSVGKTNTLIQLAKQAIMLGQQPVLYISLELAENVIQDRFDASFTGIKIQDLEQGRNPRKVRRFVKRLGEDLEGEPLVIKEFPARTITVDHIENYLLQLERQAFYPGALFLDYADLLVPLAKSRGSSYEDQGNIYVELRSLAQRRQLPIWTAAQGNRESQGKKIITMKELADSFQKAMHADVLLALCQTQEEEKRNNARFFIMKNRNGIAHIEFPVRLDHARASIINR